MRQLLSKKPWTRALPSPSGTPLLTVMQTQDDFIRQYYPSSHRIKDEMYYPDIFREIEEPVYDSDGNDTGRTVKNIYVEKVPRFAFAYQQIITLKHLVHLCGNDIQFDLNTGKESDETADDVRLFRDGWQDKDMQHAFYKFAKSVKVTGDAAFVAYIEGGEFGWDSFSFLEGDALYPHFGRDGKLSVFARAYKDFNADGSVTERLEVWDKTYLYRLHRPASCSENPVPLTFGRGVDTYMLDGYVYDDPTQGAVAHGFDRVPIAYWRNDDGPCWSASQDSIEEYEMAFSQMAHNNKAFGEPILYLQGENVAANHDMNGTIKTITMGTDDKAGYLPGQSASESYMKELGDLHERIFEQSFIVTPPELKSGDLPAAALKILYSPAVEKAMNDAEDFSPVLSEMVYLFAYGYGVEREKTLDFVNLPLRPWIKPYIHVSESTIMADLAIGVQNGFISRRTASERAWFYAVSTEADRLLAEQKESERFDLLSAFENQKLNGEETAETEE